MLQLWGISLLFLQYALANIIIELHSMTERSLDKTIIQASLLYSLLKAIIKLTILYCINSKVNKNHDLVNLKNFKPYCSASVSSMIRDTVNTRVHIL